MDKHAEKLMKRYRLSPQQAQALVDAGFKSPKDIVKAKRSELRALEGIGQATVEKLRR